MATEMIACFLLLAIFTIYHLHQRRIERRTLPPGPPGWPLVGNAMDVPVEYSWDAYTNMARQYGDIVYLHALGFNVIILSSFQRANDLLEKRSSNYSDRMSSTMVLDLLGLTWNVAMAKYGEAWRSRRRLLHNYFQSKNSYHRRAVQLPATRSLLKDISSDSTDFVKHVHRFAGSIILDSVYGHTVQGQNDPLVTLVDGAVGIFNEVTSSGLWTVDAFPLLKHIPIWFPGAHFRRIAAEGKYQLNRMLDIPFEDVKSRMVNKSASPCFTVEFLSELQSRDELPPEKVKEQEKIIKDSAGAAYGAGSETTVSSVLTFILAMLLNPEIQKKAQAELDKIVGTERLPSFEDKDDLPYIQCILLETLRWRPVLPLGIPHQSVSEDFYDGWRIPAETVVIANSWAMLHDETVYPDPDSYNPDRFIKEEGKELPPDPSDMAFGFGRRICVGRAFALDTMWITIASILSAFSIEKAQDQDGKEITTEVAYTPSLLTFPKPFRCRFIPRSKVVSDMIKNESD